MIRIAENDEQPEPPNDCRVPKLLNGHAHPSYLDDHPLVAQLPIPVLGIKFLVGTKAFRLLLSWKVYGVRRKSIRSGIRLNAASTSDFGQVIHPFIHSFHHHLLNTYYVMLRAGCWGYDVEENICPHTAYSLVGEMGTKQMVTQLKKEGQGVIEPTEGRAQVL